MTKELTAREQEVFKKLAATGKYVNTGKVLIGVAYEPKPSPMTGSEELIQNLLLGNYRSLVSDRAMVYFTVLLVVCARLFVSCSV